MMYSLKSSKEEPEPKLQTLFEKVRFEVVLDDSNIQVLSLNIIEGEDEFIPYYDREKEVLMSESSDILMSSKDIKRFISLEEDETTYYVNFRRVR